MKLYWLSLFLLTATPAWAVPPWGATPAEQAMCQARVYSRLDRSDPGSMHMHHYCDGLRFIDRAYSAMSNKQHMRFYLKESIDGFDYVLNHTQESYAMRGEVHVGKARALKLAGRKAEAVAEFYKALRYGINSTDAYQALADHYLETGNKTKALETATEGLRRNPDSKGLKRRYTEFGGKLPYPAPAPEPAPVETQAAKPDEAVAPTPIPASPAEPATDRPTTVAPVAEPVAPPKIGSPKNPYCRFCTD